MESQTPKEIIELLLQQLEKEEPVSFDLGTPELPEPDALYQLVAMGKAIVPYLLESLQHPKTKKRTAYIVLALNQLDDVRALEPLIALRADYQQLSAKDEWDYAIIGQCNLAISRLQKGKP